MKFFRDPLFIFTSQWQIFVKFKAVTQDLYSVFLQVSLDWSVWTVRFGNVSEQSKPSSSCPSLLTRSERWLYFWALILLNENENGMDNIIADWYGYADTMRSFCLCQMWMPPKKCVIEKYYAGYCFSSSSLNQDWEEITWNIHITDILNGNMGFYNIFSLIV